MEQGDILYTSIDGNLYSGKLKHINDNPSSVYLGKAEILLEKQCIDGEWLSLQSTTTVKNVALSNLKKITSVKTTYEIESEEF